MDFQNYQPARITTSIYRRAVLRPADWIRKAHLQLSRSDLDQNIVLIGSPRSGTTWIFNILNQLPRTSGLFEPLNPRWFPGVTKLGLSSRPYISPGQQNSAGVLLEYFEKVFSGKLVSLQPHWPVSIARNPASFFEYLLKRIFSKKLVVKMVRAPRLLPWLSENYPTHDFIYILRHPCGVIASQFQSRVSGFNSREHRYLDYLKVDRLPSREQILSEAVNLGIDRHILEKIKKEEFSAAGLLALVWCLDNIIPLTYRLPGKQDPELNLPRQPWLTLRYEKLLLDFEAQLEKIGNYIRITPGELQKNPHVLNLYKPKNPQDHLFRWKDVLKTAQIEEILSIVAWFEVDVDYD